MVLRYLVNIKLSVIIMENILSLFENNIPTGEKTSVIPGGQAKIRCHAEASTTPITHCHPT